MSSSALNLPEDSLLDAVETASLGRLLECLPLPAYTTDAEGRISHLNRACADLVGRTPGSDDRWCPSWKLLDHAGRPLPREQCPMAVAVREGREVRGVEVMVERADGARTWLHPHARPLRDRDGRVIGGINVLLDVTDRRREAESFSIDISEANRRESDSRLLASLGSELVRADHPQVLYERFMDGAIALMRSQFASMQRFHPGRGPAGELRLLAHRGFDPAATRFWEWVSAESTCICGLALRAGRRVVIADAEHSSLLDDGQKRAYRDAGIRAMQSTPLFSRGGRLLGMISTHWASPHEPAESDLSAFDILARQAADAIERHQAEQAIRNNEVWLAVQQHALKAALSGEPLPACLGILVLGAVARFGPASRAAFYLTNQARTALRHVVGMPEEYARAVQDFKVGADSLACGLATNTGKAVLTADVREEPRWRPWLWLPEKFGFRAVWSFPLQTARGDYVGTLAVYFPEPRHAADEDVAFAGAVTDLAAIIIARDTEAAERRQAEESLRRSEAELRRHRDNLEQLVEEQMREVVETHERLRQAERLASIGTLAAGLGHDMGNLLLPVRVRLETLASMNLPAGAREELAGLVSSAEYLRRLAAGLRLLAIDPVRAGEGRTELRDWWAEAEGVLRNILRRGVTLQAQLPQEPCWVGISKTALMQAVFNLVQNAGDALKDRPQGVVRLTARECDGHTELAVSDDGPGMTEEVRRRCMEPFYTTKPRGISTGLGLALVYALVHEAGGRVELASAPGAGTTFTLRLPAFRDRSGRGGERPGRTAYIDVKDARMRAIVAAELKMLRFGEAAGPDSADLVVADHGRVEAAGPLVALTTREHAPGALAALGERPGARAVREGLRRASREIFRR